MAVASLEALPLLSLEADAAELETFLAEMLLIFPLLGLTAFERPSASQAPRNMLLLKAKGLESRGQETAQGFLVLKGSRAAPTHVPSCHQYVVELRRVLEQRGLLIRKSEHLELAQDYTFDSPSTAASVMLGRTANGRVEWKDKSGRSLKELQAAATETGA